MPELRLEDFDPNGLSGPALFARTSMWLVTGLIPIGGLCVVGGGSTSSERDQLVIQFLESANSAGQDDKSPGGRLKVLLVHYGKDVPVVASMLSQAPDATMPIITVLSEPDGSIAYLVDAARKYSDHAVIVLLGVDETKLAVQDSKGHAWLDEVRAKLPDKTIVTALGNGRKLDALVQNGVAVRLDSLLNLDTRKPSAVLTASGRAVADVTYVRRDDNWEAQQFLPSGGDYAMVRDAMEDMEPGAYPLKAIASELGEPMSGAFRKRIQRMTADGHIARVGRGQYALPTWEIPPSNAAKGG